MARERRRSTFTARDPGFAAKLEMAPVQAPEPQLSTADDMPAPASQERQEKTDPITPAKATVTNAPRTPAKPPQQVARAAREKLAANEPASGEAQIRIYFGWPEDIVTRATPWAQKARCDVKALLQKSWAESKPEITSMLEGGIKHEDIPVGRVSSSPVRLDTSLKLSAEACLRLQKEIDPENIVGLSSPLSRWVREQMIPRAQAFLKQAGY